MCICNKSQKDKSLIMCDIYLFLKPKSLQCVLVACRCKKRIYGYKSA